MGNSYDKLNKEKEKHAKEIESRDAKIVELQTKVTKLEAEVKDLRKRLYDAGEGKGEKARLESIITTQKREKKTLENKLKDLDGSKLISSFNAERQDLIKKIKNLKFKNSIFNSLAYKFKDGLDNVIEIAYRIKNNYVDDMDYFTFVFRDDIVGLLEKMLKLLLGKSELSASKYLVKIRDGAYQLPKLYYDHVPNLKKKEVVNNILDLINLESTGYHGSNMKVNHLVTNKETKEKEHPNKFLNLDNEAQLTAIFTLLEFMYDVFSNKDHETNLMALSASWFKTI